VTLQNLKKKLVETGKVHSLATARASSSAFGLDWLAGQNFSVAFPPHENVLLIWLASSATASAFVLDEDAATEVFFNYFLLDELDEELIKSLSLGTRGWGRG
jgi:hypothetical protein